MELPIKVEGITYAIAGGDIKFLLIKRVPSDGGFWQPFTGTLEDGESLVECLRRELKEETGVEQIESIEGPFWEFEWISKSGKTITEYIYAIEIKIKSEIILDPKEHSEYRWCSYKEAIELLEKENNIEALKKVINLITTDD